MPYAEKILVACLCHLARYIFYAKFSKQRVKALYEHLGSRVSSPRSSIAQCSSFIRL